MNNRVVTTSKFLSLVLRHQPQVIGMELDAEGWLPIEELIANANRHGKHLTRQLLDEVVETNDKKRFIISDDGLRIRANQGHSVEAVDLNLQPQTPPELLYHGTVNEFLDSIRKSGLTKQKRHHVHLSADETTATKVGSRRGKPVILIVRAADMHRSGHAFYLSANGVWLADAVPSEFIQFPD